MTAPMPTVHTLAPSKLQQSYGPLEKARSTPVPVLHEEPTKQPLERARTLSVVSTDSSTSAISPNSTPFQSPVSESAGFRTPQSAAASPLSAFPPGFNPGEPILGPLPRTISLVSNGSNLSLQRSASINATGRPYPPGLGWTPQVTPHDPEDLQRKLSFGFSLEDTKLRRTSTELDSVFEGQIQDHCFSRELLLFYGGMGSDPVDADPAEVGFLWPQPGFFRMQAIQMPEKENMQKGTSKEEPKQPKPKQPKAKAEPKNKIPPPPPPPKADKTKEGNAMHNGKGTAGHNHGWKGNGKGQGWTQQGWQQGWPQGWSKGWEGWSW